MSRNPRRHRAHWRAIVNGAEHSFLYNPKTNALFVWQRHSKRKRMLTNEQIALLAVEPPRREKAEDPRQIHLPFGEAAPCSQPSPEEPPCPVLSTQH